MSDRLTDEMIGWVEQAATFGSIESETAWGPEVRALVAEVRASRAASAAPLPSESEGARCGETRLDEGCVEPVQGHAEGPPTLNGRRVLLHKSAGGLAWFTYRDEQAAPRSSEEPRPDCDECNGTGIVTRAFATPHDQPCPACAGRGGDEAVIECALCGCPLAGRHEGHAAEVTALRERAEAAERERDEARAELSRERLAHGTTADARFDAEEAAGEAREALRALRAEIEDRRDRWLFNTSRTLDVSTMAMCGAELRAILERLAGARGAGSGGVEGNGKLPANSPRGSGGER